MEKTGCIDLYVDMNITFYVCSVKCSVKVAFWYFITCYKYSLRNFQKTFRQTVIPSVAFLYSLSICAVTVLTDTVTRCQGLNQ